MKDFRQELTENSYFRQEELVFWDCDREKRMRVAAMLSKMAAFAGYDYDARGLTYEKLYAMREVFLLSRVALKVHACPRARDLLDITTWENGARGAHMQRVFEMRDQAGQLCSSAKSDWILVDGGIRTGMDVFKALALGADAVLIGRPFVNMVYGGGAEGVKVYVEKLKAELADTMAMCGAHSLSDINRSMIFGY